MSKPDTALTRVKRLSPAPFSAMSGQSTKPLAPFSVFIRRLLFSLLLSSVLLFTTLMIGIAGYHWIGEMAWVDALLNASMILGGMGPVNELKTDAAKIFASGYALFCGLVLVGAMGLVLAPILHRMLHKFHLDEQDFDGRG